MTLAAWLHDISPIAVKLGPLPIRWYGLSYALGFLVGWLILRWLAIRRVVLIPPARVGDAILYAVVGVVVGGRLGYVLVYEPRLLWTFSGSPPWWGLLSINQGGMASHGGMVGVIIAAFLIARGFKDEKGEVHGRAPVLHILDALALITPTGLMFGRIANFVNGELLGKVVAPPGAPSPWWAVKFPQEVLVGIPPRTKEQLDQIEAIVTQAVPQAKTFEGGYQRVMEMIQHGDRALAAQLEPLIAARVPSQLFQAAAEGIGVGIVVWLVARRPRLPGVVGCAFLISYGVFRIITEQFWRLPDAQFTNPRPYGLSRGQWLSVLMVVAGVGFLIWILRRGGKKLGGWGVRHLSDGTPEGESGAAAAAGA